MYISLSNCARKYNIDKSVLRNMCQSGELQAKKCGNGWRIVEDNIEGKNFAKPHKKAKIDWNIVAHSNNVCAGKKQKPSKEKINYALQKGSNRTGILYGIGAIIICVASAIVAIALGWTGI